MAPQNPDIVTIRCSGFLFWRGLRRVNKKLKTEEFRSETVPIRQTVPNPFRKMATARLYIDEKKKTKKGKVSIYCLVHIANKTLKINTGVSTLFDKYDPAKQRIKGTSKEDHDNNLIIDKCLSSINEIFVRYRLQNRVLTPDLLLREYKNPTNYIDFHSWMDKKIDERVKNKEIGAVSGRHQRVLLNKLKEYKPELSFAEIDLKFITNFRGWLRTKKGNSVNTVQKTFGYFRAYLNLAVREEIISVNPIDLIELKRTSVNITYLTEAELKTLIKFYDKGHFQENYHQVLRHFLFMCLTGVRISDLQRLKREHIQENALKFVPYKTLYKKGAEIYVPVIEKGFELIADEQSQTEFLFNCISDQKMNEYLKKIADLAGIKKKIRNHAGRHTFATLFITKTKDVATLQRILGHSNISETMKYVHISNKEIDEQMKVFDSLLAINKKPGN